MSNKRSSARTRSESISYDPLEPKNLLAAVVNPIDVNTHPVSFGGGKDVMFQDMVEFNDGVLFAAETEHGNELWFGDGNQHGNMVLDVIPGPSGLQPRALTVLGDQVLFIGHDYRGANLWRQTARGPDW